jgi:adenylate kinase family enzyme
MQICTHVNQQEQVRSDASLLDGYPRSAEQAEAIEQASIRPDLFLLINVSAYLHRASILIEG